MSLTAELAAWLADEAEARGVTESYLAAELIQAARTAEHAVAGISLPSIRSLIDLDKRWGIEQVDRHPGGTCFRGRLEPAIAQAEKERARLHAARVAADALTRAINLAQEMRAETRSRLVAEAKSEREKAAEASERHRERRHADTAASLDTQLEQLDWATREDQAAIDRAYHMLYAAQRQELVTRSELADVIGIGVGVELGLVREKLRRESDRAADKLNRTPRPGARE